MRHIVLYSTVHAFDGLEALPLDCVTVVGVAADDVEAIDMISAHHAANSGDLDPDRRTYTGLEGDLWYLRGSGEKGDEISAGLGHSYNKRTYYRAVPLADELRYERFEGVMALDAGTWFLGDAAETMGMLNIPRDLRDGPVKVHRGDTLVGIVTRSIDQKSGRACICPKSLTPKRGIVITHDRLIVSTLKRSDNQPALGTPIRDYDLLIVDGDGKNLATLA